MHYLIQGKLIRATDVISQSHEDFLQLLHKRFIPTLQLLGKEIPHGTILGGGMPAGGRDVVFLVDLRGGQSHRIVRQFLVSLPIFEYYEWQTTPLDSFEELLESYGVKS